MSNLLERLRVSPSMIDCHDAALALEQAEYLLRKSIREEDPLTLIEIRQWLNTWTKDEEEE